ncbi:MAG: ion transporter [Candidatus Aminicenantes bacterium]|nr:ion transporter [Candidatus Aminicenantes bacterium]
MTEKKDSKHPAVPGSLREKIQFYLIDCKTIPGKLIDIFIIFLNIVVCILFVIDTYPIPEATSQFIWKLEIIIIFFFIIEYVARLYGSRNRIKHIFNIFSLIDLVAILPILSFLFLPSPLKIGFIRIIRVLRIFRFLRFTKDPVFFFGNISIRLLKVIRLLFTILLIFFVSSGLVWFAEHEVNKQIKNFGDAFYFSVVSLTTVGFGDITPISEGGRWVTVLMIFSGIILIPWQVGQIIKEWLGFAAKKEAVCPQCGLKYHDKDASHCKACGQVIFQEYDGL